MTMGRRIAIKWVLRSGAAELRSAGQPRAAVPTRAFKPQRLGRPPGFLGFEEGDGYVVDGDGGGGASVEFAVVGVAVEDQVGCPPRHGALRIHIGVPAGLK